MRLVRVLPILLSLSLRTSASDDIQRVRELLSAGLTRVFWQNLRSEVRDSVSQPCVDSLLLTLQGLRSGFGWSYAFIDASSKISSGTLDGSASSFGDYDQCLSIKSATHPVVFNGQYCMVRLLMRSNQSTEVLKTLENKYPVFEYIHLHQAICLPSACSQAEAARLIQSTLQGYPLLMTEEFLCDTLESTSWTGKVWNANTAQVVAATVLSLMTVLCLLATFQDFMTNKSSVLRDFSLRQNFSRLVAFNKRAGQNRLEMLDYVKFFTIVAGIGGHCVSCLETVPSWYTFARLYDVKMKFKSFFAQPLMNEAGLGLVTYAGGFLTFWSSHKLIAKGDFQIGAALFEKWIRFMPSVMMMVAIDLLWPMYGSGPMFTGIANHLLNKCTHYSWMNFLFINNFKTAPENCVPHTFYSSIDFQLFAIGLIATTLLVKRVRVGVLVSFGLIVLGNVLLIYFTMKNQTSPSLIDAEATRTKTLNYLDYVHFGTYSHLSNYFIGILSAFAVSAEGMLQRHSKIISLSYNVAVVLSATLHFAPALHNTFGLLPQELVPFYISAIKFCYVFYFSVFLFVNVNRYWTETNGSGRNLNAARNTNLFVQIMLKIRLRINDWLFEALDYVYSSPLTRLLVNLSFALYVSNYSYIRYDFFTSRVGMSLATNTVYSIVNRFVYSIGFAITFAFIFQLMFVAPFDNLRRRFKAGKPEKSQ